MTNHIDKNNEGNSQGLSSQAQTASDVERVTVSSDPSTSGPVVLPRDAERTNRFNRKRNQQKWSSRFSYTTRVTVAFAFIAAMTALVAIGVLSFVWQQYFQSYTQENMQSLADSAATTLSETYETTGTLNSPEVTSVALYAESLSSGVGIEIVENPSGNVIFNSAEVSINNDTFSFDDESFIKSLSPSSSSMASSAIVVDGVAVGSVRVWVYGSEALLTQADEAFRDSSYEAMIFASLFAIVLASCIGFLFARALVNPINKMTTTAKAIKDGDLSSRTNLRGDDEIARLGEMFDQMADSVERDQALERRLTTDVAHELRTPLMAIQSTVEAMVDGVFEADEERLETVNAEVQRLSRLVDAILKLSRLENRSNPLKDDPIDVGELLTGIILTHEAFVADSGLTFSHELDPGVIVKGDADLIRQATANLISNAVRYTPEGGHISVKVKGGDIMASISVEDTGIGLTPEEAKMVFSRFWRADAGRTRESGGLGIGLSVVKEIVDRHGGWVQVEGAKDKGACFTIHIPLYDAEEEARANKRAKSGENSRKRR